MSEPRKIQGLVLFLTLSIHKPGFGCQFTAGCDVIPISDCCIACLLNGKVYSFVISADSATTIGV